MSPFPEFSLPADFNAIKPSHPSSSSFFYSSSSSVKGPHSLTKCTALAWPLESGNRSHPYGPSAYNQAKEAGLRSGINTTQDKERLREANRKLHEVAFVLPKREMEPRKAAEKRKWVEKTQYGSPEVREMLERNRALRKAAKEGKGNGGWDGV